MSAPAEAFQASVGYRFRNPELLTRALTHKSRVFERAAPGGFRDNEQLEFLGDSILGFLVSEKLLQLYPDAAEGRLSKLKAHLVSSTHLLQIALDLHLGDFLLLGRGEEMSGGREKKALLADAMEAILAAVYLDGGITAARDLVERHIFGQFDSADEALAGAPDYKSTLQEIAQSMKLPQPRYAIVDERGPQHAKTFLVEVRVGRDLVGQAEGASKKIAGQKAAQKVVDQLRAV